MKNQQSYNTFEAALAEGGSLNLSLLMNGREAEADVKEMVRTPKVLMYHRIVDDPWLARNWKFCLHVDEFHRQIKLIERMNYTPITFEGYRLFLANKLQLPQKPVILTFDDGYLDTYRLACPLLKKYGMRGVFFVLGDRSIRSNVWDTGRPDIPGAHLMSDHHLMELHEEGFEIGAHSLSHPELLRLGSEESFREIRRSKTVLESLLGGRVTSFSYPYGQVSGRIKQQVRRAGYRFACSVYSGPPSLGEDPLEIRRIEIYNSMSLMGFATRLMMPYEYLEWMWWRARYRHSA